MVLGHSFTLVLRFDQDFLFCIFHFLVAQIENTIYNSEELLQCDSGKYEIN